MNRDEETLTESCSTATRRRPSAEGRVAYPPRAARTALAGVLLAGGLSASCAFSNYDFESLGAARGDARGEGLAAALEVEIAEGEHRELYDVHYVPLAHASLTVFTEEKDDELPEGFVEMALDSYLPFFGFVDASVRRYDADRRLYERSDHDSYLWGLFQTHRDQIATRNGLREQTKRTLLWFFDWTSSPRYIAEAGGTP